MPYNSCLFCNKEFYVKPSLVVRECGKYCSIQCKNEAQKKGKSILCAYCGKEVYRSRASLQEKSKSGKYFCTKSCHCASKNKKRAHTIKNTVNSILKPLKTKLKKIRKKKTYHLFLKRPSKKTLRDLYWKKNYSQTEIAKIFNATHASTRRWLKHYKISIKPRTVSCGRNPNSIKNLELGKTPEVEKKSAESRRIYSKEKLIEKIKEFIQKEGRIPSKREFSKHPSYPDYQTYRDYFGTWNNAIRDAGYEPALSWFSPKNLCAKDGHRCNSISEIIIDDWLFENNIPHYKEYLYPERRYRCDFVVKNIFIEFFGLANAPNLAPSYNETMERKRKICKKHNIHLVELYEKDIHNLNQTLGEKLKLEQKTLFSL